MKLNLKTISPVAITDGNVLSNISDYYLDNDAVHYIDNRKVESFFLKHPDLIEKFVNATLKSNENNRSNINFKADVLQKIMKVNPADYVKYSLPARGVPDSSKVQIKTIMKSAGKPYLPGSSIKGAIKTALLYDWLIEANAGKNFLNNLCSNLKSRNFDKYGFLSDIEKHIRQFALKENTNGFVRTFRVSDTNTLPIDKVEVIKTHRLHLTNSEKQGNIPIVTEAIMEGNEFELELTDQGIINDPELLFDAVSIFNQSVLWFEWDLLDQKIAIDNKNKKTLSSYYEKINKLIEKETDKMYLRVGSGKSNFNNSIGLAVYKNDEDSYKKMRKILRIGEEDSKYFPLTRSVIVDDKSQLGWVEISKI